MKQIKTAITTVVIASMLSGCIGQMATTGFVMHEVNIKGVDNRYGRAGLYTLMSPVYAITSMADLFVVNSIEFWTGTNPLSKKKALADMPANSYIKVNHKMNKNLTSAPVKISMIDGTTTQMDFTDESGSVRTLIGVNSDSSVDFYLDGDYITTATHDELIAYSSLSS